MPSIDIPNSVTSISSYAFYGCSRLTSFVVPNSVTGIGGYAFEFCSSLTSITIGSSVKSIDGTAFKGCNNLTSVNINDLSAWCEIKFYSVDANPLYFAHHLYLNGEEVKDLIIPNSVTTINPLAFYGCTGLTSVSIPNSVNTIECEAFANCTNLSNISIGSGVNYINSSFVNCTNLETVTCYAESVPSSGGAFSNSLIEYSTLYVPAASLDIYKSTAPWSGFGTIKPIGDVEIKTCATPKLTIVKGGLHFVCDTEGSVIHYKLTPNAIVQEGDFVDDIMIDEAIYTLTFYATANGYAQSETVTATISYDKADVNRDGKVSISDVTEIVHILESNNH